MRPKSPSTSDRISGFGGGGGGADGLGFKVSEGSGFRVYLGLRATDLA